MIFPPFVCACRCRGKMLFWSAAWSGRNDDNGAPIVLLLIRFLSGRRLINCFLSQPCKCRVRTKVQRRRRRASGARCKLKLLAGNCLSLSLSAARRVKLECAAALVCVSFDGIRLCFNWICIVRDKHLIAYTHPLGALCF
jgi:hypothetical protein